jgi:hypothetical protein
VEAAGVGLDRAFRNRPVIAFSPKIAPAQHARSAEHAFHSPKSAPAGEAPIRQGLRSELRSHTRPWKHSSQRTVTPSSPSPNGTARAMFVCSGRSLAATRPRPAMSTCSSPPPSTPARGFRPDSNWIWNNCSGVGSTWSPRTGSTGSCDNEYSGKPDPCESKWEVGVRQSPPPVRPLSGCRASCTVAAA